MSLRATEDLTPWARPAPIRIMLRRAACLLVLTVPALAAPAAKPSPSPALRARIVALVLRQSDFGAISLIPVRFEDSRLAGPFEEGGKTHYCVATRMLGRTFGRAERRRALLRDEGGALRVERYDADVCAGHRTEPFTELDGRH